MTPVPEDDLEQALRRALSAAASQVEPGADGLERIRARTKKRPPQPWLLAVVGGALSRVRYWVWRGHWSWPERFPRVSALPRPSSIPWPRSRRLPLPVGSTLATQSVKGGRLRRLFSGPDGANWLRPVGVLAGVAFIAAIALGVPTFRSTIVQVSSTVLTGGQSSGGSGTDGSAKPAGSGTSPGSAKSSGATGTTAGSTAASPGALTTSGCTQSAAGSSQGGSGANPGSTAAQVTAPNPHSPVPSASRYYTSTTSGCPTPGGSPAASPSATSSASPSSTPSSTGSPTSSPSPTGSPTSSPSPTGSPTSSPSPTDSPSDSPSSTVGGPNQGANSTSPTSSGTPTGSSS